MKLKKSHIAALIVLILLALGYFAYKNYYSSEIGWKVSKEGIMRFKVPDKIEFSKTPYNENEYFTIEKIIYQSKDAQIHGLLITPYSLEELPGLVYLPGAGVSKESALNVSATIASLGFIVLVIDQRGIGETKAPLANIDRDFAGFTDKKEPFQHLMVYDALLAARILDKMPGIEKGSIFIAGESMGGRNAMIAAAIGPSIKGVLAISSSGFGFLPKGDEEKDRFIESLDPDNYVRLIPPRRFVMLHNIQDQMIPFDSAVATYKTAGEPKNFFYINETSCKHGYCAGMHTALKESLYFLASAKV